MYFVFVLKQYKKLEKTIGQRVKIYWKDDKQWYYGKIVKYDSIRKKSNVLYDDGEDEWLSLGSETVEYLETINQTENDSDTNNINSNVTDNEKQKTNNKKESITHTKNDVKRCKETLKRSNTLYNNNNNNNSRRLSIGSNINDESFSCNIFNIGDKINSRGIVNNLFDHGFSTTLKIGDKKYKTIAFDADYIDYLMHSRKILNDPFSNLHAIYQLLNLCTFGYVLYANTNKCFPLILAHMFIVLCID